MVFFLEHVQLLPELHLSQITRLTHPHTATLVGDCRRVSVPYITVGCFYSMATLTKVRLEIDLHVLIYPLRGEIKDGRHVEQLTSCPIMQSHVWSAKMPTIYTLR
ncbi:hypothetical protein V6Z94_000248 [Aspergillus fumigatus]